MSAPLVVNTRDGMCWTRRTVTQSGLALYAPAGACDCPPFRMATLAELAEHGIVGSADVLPVPAGDVPQASRPIAYAAKNTDLLLADAAERSRAAEWPWDMWCRICHIRPTSHRTEAEALEAADRHVKLEHAPQAEVHKLMAAGGLAELERLSARIAELEAERHSTNEALSDAAVQLRADRDRIAELEDLQRLVTVLEIPRPGRLPLQVRLAHGHDDRWMICDREGRRWHREHGWVFEAQGIRDEELLGATRFTLDEVVPLARQLADDPDGITRRIAPTQAMQVEDPCHPCGCPKRFNRHADGCPTLPEGEHYAAVHHAYRTGRDLPETGGAR